MTAEKQRDWWILEYQLRCGWYNFACQVAIAALLQREHRRWLGYGGLSGPGEGAI